MKDYNIKDETITVTQLNKLAKTLLENNMPICWISGEISGVKTYSHIYFDLKDDKAKVSCVMFASVLPLLDFKLENGLKVEIRGKVTIYPQNGSYQINVERIRRIGLGELWEAYNRLLIKLRTEGLFENIHKKLIPIFPKAIGVITSKEGAVIRDVVTTLRRRMPNIPIIIYHTAVQGQDSAMQVTKAIRVANIRSEVDVLIICRGGGSMEDLWCFNEEVVAREVFSSQIPIISAIGHETDTTIIDFVADLRAPTPTGAAELVAKSKSEWDSLLNRLHSQLAYRFESILNDRKQRLDSYYRQLKILNPINQLTVKKTRLINYQERILSSLLRRITANKLQLGFFQSKLDVKKINLSKYYLKLEYLYKCLNNAFNNRIIGGSNRLSNLANSLSLVNPNSILKRGYAIVRSSSGRVVYQAKSVKQHERLEIILAEDTLSAIVDKKYNKEQPELY